MPFTGSYIPSFPLERRITSFFLAGHYLHRSESREGAHCPGHVFHSGKLWLRVLRSKLIEVCLLELRVWQSCTVSGPGLLNSTMLFP